MAPASVSWRPAFLGEIATYLGAAALALAVVAIAVHLIMVLAFGQDHLLPPTDGQSLETALYYTFSTIAQALAAAMGLLAAFTMYRLKGLDDEGRKLAELVELNTNGGTGLRPYYYRSDWLGLLASGELQRRREQATPQLVAEIIDPLLTRIRRIHKASQEIRCPLWSSLGMTATVMALSIGVLSLVPRIVIGSLAGSVLSVGVLATVLCLVAYSWLLVEAFRA